MDKIDGYSKIKPKKFLIFFLTIFIAGNFFIIQPVQADSWGANVGASRLKQVMEEIYTYIKNIVLGAAKQAAVESITSSVNSMISGGSGDGPLFITDWNDELSLKPAYRARTRFEGYLTQVVRGTGSSSNYIATGSGEGTSANYSTYLSKQARNSTIESQTPQTDIQSYTSDPSNMFSQGNWRGFNSFISNPANNPYGLTLMSQDTYQSMLEEEKREAEIKAVAYQGFKGSESNGQIVTPGSSIKDIQSNATKMGFDTISGAKSVPEVITSLVTKLVTKVVREGIGNVQRNSQRKVSSFSSF